uniref:Uncharacterized protein n=1 Tax=Riquetophycus sp. TaxID=1897556 RepID=A0A1C9C8B9_9FLOR|nr:hypothetical protein Riqu_144 [Riquetophycus sp.]
MNFSHKIKLLLITIESLNLYTHDLLKSKTININQEINFIKYNHLISNIYTENSILLIINIYNLIKTKYLQEIVNKILKDYSNRCKCKLTLQYLKRYIYIYSKTQKYYSKNDQNNNINIQNIAITNLYIIKKINQVQGLFFMIQYLMI